MTALSERTGLNFNKHKRTHSEKSGMNDCSVRVRKRVGKFHSKRVKFHSVRVRMDEVSLEKSNISLFSSETIITLNIHSFTLREYGKVCLLSYKMKYAVLYCKLYYYNRQTKMN